MANTLSRAGCVFVLCGCASLHASVAQGEEQQATPFAERAQEARAAEEGLEYEVAKGLWLELSARQDLDAAELAEANLNAGRMAQLLGVDDEARRHFRVALELQPGAKLTEDDPPRLRDFFEQVRREVAQEAQRRAEEEERARAAAAASRPAPATESAMSIELPPAVLGGAAAAGGGALVLGLGGLAGLLSAQANDEAEDEVIQLNRGALYDARDGWAIAANLSFLTGVVLLVSGGGLVAWTLLEEQE